VTVVSDAMSLSCIPATLALVYELGAHVTLNDLELSFSSSTTVGTVARERPSIAVISSVNERGCISRDIWLWKCVQ